MEEAYWFQEVMSDVAWLRALLAGVFVAFLFATWLLIIERRHSGRLHAMAVEASVMGSRFRSDNLRMRAEIERLDEVNAHMYRLLNGKGIGDILERPRPEETPDV